MIAVLLATAGLAAGTYAFRLSGVLLRRKIRITKRAKRIMDVCVVCLFAAVVATSALTEGHGFAGFARPAGVLVAAVLAWRKVPFAIVVLAAAAVAAGLRLLGVP